MSLKLLAHPDEHAISGDRMSETLALSAIHVEFLERISQGINPDMPSAFGWPHAIRAILEHFEESGIDFTAASSEEEIAAIAAAQLQTTEPLYASAPLRSATRPEYRSSRPVTGRRRSGKPPRSNRG
jgi:hypothetical protein